MSLVKKEKEIVQVFVAPGAKCCKQTAQDCETTFS